MHLSLIKDSEPKVVPRQVHESIVASRDQRIRALEAENEMPRKSLAKHKARF